MIDVSIGGGAARERARSESGKENSATGVSRTSTWRPVTRHKTRSSERGLRERSVEDTDDERCDSPVEYCLTDSALPSDSDHPWGDQHSSEEELECINGPSHSVLSVTAAAASATSAATATDKTARQIQVKTPLQVCFSIFRFFDISICFFDMPRVVAWPGVDMLTFTSPFW